MENIAPPQSENENAANDEYTQFVAKIAEYHNQRGTFFEPQPKVGAKPANILSLWKAVIARGGYDKVSDEKLAWRKLAADLGFGGNNLPAAAFQLKTIFYKYLAAYEIKTLHGREPPPREILEDLTAKGGNLLTRTLENFRPSARRETSQLGGHDGSDASDMDGTPNRDAMGGDVIEGSGGRATRGLRQAPPQRVLFQPDTRPSRNMGGQNNHNIPTSTPTPARPSYGYTSNSHGGPDNEFVAKYEPPTQKISLTMKPVYTPANNPAEFNRMHGRNKVAPQSKIMLPGTGYDGPNIYVRCLLALKSGIEAEQHYALHHLVKISMERGDKYRFESFAGLAEALVEKILEVTSLVSDTNWQIVYPEDGKPRNNTTLDALDGTLDILERLTGLATKHDLSDTIQDGDFRSKLLLIIQASLALRNMVMLEDNAAYVSDMKPLRDMLSIVLNLPPLETFVELRHNALEITEQLTKYLHFEANDPLYLTLLRELDTTDRGAILTSLRAISKMSMLLEETNRLPGVPLSTLETLCSWLLLEDEDLVNSALDFLYQYTAVTSNLDFMISNINLNSLINQVSLLLTRDCEPYDREFIVVPQKRNPPPADIPEVPKDLMDQLMPLPEPERSSKWLKCVFEEDKDAFITQIALWQAYQQRFDQSRLPGPNGERLSPKYPNLLAASEFIKNVSTTFQDKAAAQVQGGPVQKFIIKGIRIRDGPTDLTGKTYSRCKWVGDVDTPTGRAMLQCNQFFINAESMYNHILTSHVGVPKTEDGKFKNEAKEYQCLWAGCKKYLSPHNMKTTQFGSHLKTHLPVEKTEIAKAASKENEGQPSYIEPAVTKKFKYLLTSTDEHGEVTGIPLTAILVLRNLARNLPKTDAEEEAQKKGEIGYVTRYFKAVEPRLFDLLAHNKTMVSKVFKVVIPRNPDANMVQANYLTDLISTISE